MPIISVMIMKTIDERESLIKGVLCWDAVIAKCNKDGKRCR